jgi:hypothetical protein
MSVAKDAQVRALITRWIAYRSAIPEPGRYDQLRSDLYLVRNPGFNGAPPLSSWPSTLVDPDPEVMASVEHYFLTRSWVGNGVYPAWEVRVLAATYNLGKKMGLSPRHNPSNPVTPPSEMQKRFQAEGIRDGESDLKKSGKPTPGVAMPPKYY